MVGKVLALRLRQRVSALDGRALVAAVRAHETAAPSDELGWVWRARFRSAEPGDLLSVPVSALRPGQHQIALENVRAKMVRMTDRLGALVDRIARAPADEIQRGSAQLLQKGKALPVVVGPGGRYLVLADGHHHVAALKGTLHLLSVVLEGDLGRPDLRPRELRRLEAMREGLQSCSALGFIRVHVTQNLGHLAEDEFWPGMARENLVHVHPGALPPRVPPTAFHALTDNPYRYLAAATAGKVRFGRKGKRPVKLRGPEYPVWLKLQDAAPPFVEFEIAELYAAAFRRQGFEYDASTPITAVIRSLARAALRDAHGDARHPSVLLLRRPMVVPEDIHADQLERVLQRSLARAL